MFPGSLTEFFEERGGGGVIEISGSPPLSGMKILRMLTKIGDENSAILTKMLTGVLSKEGASTST